ncbi:MAG: helix-turn-helix domain-containing protein [Alphaproteobacteria bacterium]|nr:helix-turn-helix domain-containing protein [Alphaproteobacteria bacterium]MBN2780283.1 helix-turn-helix domain-containing protein [Alphaproteobacteria bacterium]
MVDEKIKPLHSKYPHEIDSHIGKRVRLRRKILKMNQTEVASLVGVTFQQFQKYEAGTNRISASRLFVLAQVLGVSINFFYEGFDRLQQMFALPEYEGAIAENQKILDKDPMQQKESLELVRMFWSIKDAAKRKKVLDMVAMISGVSEEPK